MTKAPAHIRLSICVPTYNRAAQLISMLTTLMQEVNQHPRRAEIEICISDNGSTDDTALVVSECSARFPNITLRQKTQVNNIGFSANFIAVARLATGSGFVVLADDDALADNAIDLMWNAVQLLSDSMPLVLFNSLPGGDAKDRRMTLPFSETTIAGPDELLERLGIFHASFISNLLFHRESALKQWCDNMAQSRYPHMALAATLLSTKPARFHPEALVHVYLPADASDQPLLTSVDMAQLQSTYILSDRRCRPLIGWVYRYLVRMVPTAVLLMRKNGYPANTTNPYSDLRRPNVATCYRHSALWRCIALTLWWTAILTPLPLLSCILRKFSRHPR